jgi:hypothetical protein
MEQLRLTFSPNTLSQIGDYLLDEEKASEFITRLEAILFHDYCTFFYNPKEQEEIDTALELVNETQGLATRFRGMLASNNCEEADNTYAGYTVFDYKGHGHSIPLEATTLVRLYEQENTALIEFSSKTEPYEIQTYLDKRGTMEDNKKFKVLPTYRAFSEWANTRRPRRFDEQYTRDKHFDPNYSSAASTDKIKRGNPSAILRCSFEEAKEILHFAFHKDRNHEDFLFFHHQSASNEFPVLLFKASRGSKDTQFHFHAYHVQEIELIQKYKTTLDDLRKLSDYVRQQLT